MQKWKIKACLRKGGLVLAKRRTGKTAALMELLQENSNFVLLVHNTSIKNQLLQDFGNKYASRIFDSSKNLRGVKNWTKYLLIDEYFLCNYNGGFFAATATNHFEIHDVDQIEIKHADILEAVLNGDINQDQMSKEIEALRQD